MLCLKRQPDEIIKITAGSDVILIHPLQKGHMNKLGIEAAKHVQIERIKMYIPEHKPAAAAAKPLRQAAAKPLRQAASRRVVTNTREFESLHYKSTSRHI